MVDITPSLKAGKMDDNMRCQKCNHYFIGSVDFAKATEKERLTYYYISRFEPQTLHYVDNGTEAILIRTKNQEYQSDFKYHDDNIYMSHHCVVNPQNAGAVGIIIPRNNGGRTLIVSGPLSGCGFAVLIRDDNIFVIHAGGSNDAKVKQMDKQMDKQRRRMINRDIFLMANALSQPEQYTDFLENNKEGMTCKVLFRKLQKQGFKGFIYVQKNKDQLIYTDESVNFAIWSYCRDYIHDVVFMRNEEGNMSSAIRGMTCDKLTEINTNELFNRQTRKKPDDCIIV